MNRKFQFVLLGCGGRGTLFANWLADHPDAGSVVAAADPDENALLAVAEKHNIPAAKRFRSWEELLSEKRFGDVAINTTMDRLHCASATRALERGYHMLLEKPMATTLDECITIDLAATRHNRIVSVCHSMRYHRVYQQVKQLIQEGAIGRIVTFDQLEPVEPIHQSHSFVRGNWAQESTSTFMLLAKSCHDLDVLAWLVNRPCRHVSSFGSLTYFCRENAPPMSGERCTDCQIEAGCMYSAKKIYLPSDSAWATHARISGSPEERLRQLEANSYGRCVWKCDNDVVDHQVVNCEFEGGVTGTFTMTAFGSGGRCLRLHGTDGWLKASVDRNEIEVERYSDRVRKTIRIESAEGTHGGADAGVMENLLCALRADDPSIVLTNTSESLASHRIVFAAEHARRSRAVIAVND
jgi:predicted dehydrogenase